MQPAVPQRLQWFSQITKIYQPVLSGDRNLTQLEGLGGVLISYWLVNKESAQ
jgi:hypothetical protein